MTAEGNEKDLSNESDNEEAGSTLSLRDKIWVGLAIALFVLAFLAVLIFGVF